VQSHDTNRRGKEKMMPELLDFILFTLSFWLMSVVAHELFHYWMAKSFDKKAKMTIQTTAMLDDRQLKLVAAAGAAGGFLFLIIWVVALSQSDRYLYPVLVALGLYIWGNRSDLKLFKIDGGM
jgi:hypothetical protein